MAIFKAAVHCKKFGKLFVYRSWKNFMERKGQVNEAIMKDINNLDCAAKSRKCYLFAPFSFYEACPERCSDILLAAECSKCISIAEKTLDTYRKN